MELIDPAAAMRALDALGAVDWAKRLPWQLEEVLERNRHGDLTAWRAALETLPTVAAAQVRLAAPAIAATGTIEDAERTRIRAGLAALHPWRKGPFNLFGVYLDSEWRCDWKWARLTPHLAALRDRRILDVGCGNGYYAWRMLGAGAALVIGIDPTLRFLAQFRAIRHLLDPGANLPVHLLPLGIEQLPPELEVFDTVFSLGVIYHRRDPRQHLAQLRGSLRPGGELVLESLVVAGDVDHVLRPEPRYAKMRNVWSIPSVAALEAWLRHAGFVDVRTVDVSTTTCEEQRATPWMRFESLTDFLDPGDPRRTVEGFPAPRRALVLATAP